MISFTRPKVSHIADAMVIGDLESPECDAILNTRTVVGSAAHAPKVMGDKWMRWDAPWGDVVAAMTKHPEKKDKGGDAMFFAESARTGKKFEDKNDRGSWDYMYRLKKKFQRVNAVAIDVDGGCTIEPVIARLRMMGLFAVIYTTHSHTTKGRAGSDRFRVIIPLSEPFELGDRDDDPDAWQERYATWEAKYFGFCENLISGEFDARGRLPSQLMYMPARPKGAEFKHYIIAGRGLSLDEMPAGDVSKYRRRAPSGAKGGGGDVGEPAFLSDGFDLLSWWSDHGSDFLLRDFLEMVGWDVLGDSGEGFDITCPNAAAHSAGGEDMAWAIDGPDADSRATIFCHHDHCDGFYTWGFLRMIEEQSGLPDGYNTLSALLCDLNRPGFTGE